jgi:hypothetical protein
MAAAPARATVARVGGPIRVLHQRFVLARLLLGDTNDAIHAALEREDLDDLDDVMIDRLRAELTPPRRFNVRSLKHRASLEYLDAVGVRDLVHRTPEAQEALMLLRTPRAREVVEVGLIVQAPAEGIASQLRHQKLSVTGKSISLFEQGFWSVSAFDRTSLRSTLELRAVRRALRGAVDDDERRVALRAARSDARLLAASLPRSPVSWYLVLGALGHSPAAVPVDKVLEQLRSHAALRAVESVMRGGPGDEARAFAFMNLLRGAHELHQSVVPPDSALRESLASIQLVTNPNPIPYIHDLTGGNHTLDIQGSAERAGEA